MISIITIGKKHEPWLKEAIDRYEKQLKKPFDIEWILVQNSSQKGDTARDVESEQIIKKLKQDDFVLLLDERGELLDSPTFSQNIAQPLEQSKRVVVIIGGAYGVNEALRQRANLLWSLSPLVFPHQLVRLILVEQSYRAQAIHHNLPYHHL